MPPVRVVLGLLTFGPPGSEPYGSRITDIGPRTYVNGLQEAFTREARWQQRGLSIATKWYTYEKGHHAKAMVKSQLEKSLAELGTDSVSIFYLHAPDRSVPFEETLEACNELHQAGKFKQLGLSNYAAWEVAELCTIAKSRGWVQPTVYQAMYNAFTRAIEDELIPCCQKFGISILIYNPLAGGVLSGRYKNREAPTDGRFSDTDATVGKMYRDRYFHDQNFAALELLEPIVKEHELSLPQVALRWCAYHSKLDSSKGDGIVIGVSSFDQLRANLDHLQEGLLPDAIVQALDIAWDQHTRLSCPLYWR
ncbi:hypothetical protein B9Z65_7395 [Elsinoe australis]|uniref:NADP-dependent oxidoreductase domain-containing protein n=1 Tax=Elsinoe australis TaxID=40998 RepID=A0A2P7YC07_9PEZI|nr:hypothetical protein B9Z65_7395 [Elsinoe australis]